MFLLTLLLSLPLLITSNASTSICNVLALSGGGSFGAVEMGILDSLLTSEKVSPTFDIVTGISAGGLNSAFLSFFKNASDAMPAIKNIYSTLQTKDVYTSDIFGILNNWSIYNNAPLQTTLSNIISSQKQEYPAPLTLIGASNVNSSKLDVFDFSSASFTQKIDILMATSAIPLIFPPRFINNSMYVDGGVISNELISEVIGQQPCSSYNLTFISASLQDGPNVPVSGLFSFIDAVLHTILRTFDSQMAEQTSCSYPKGTLTSCYPTSQDLNNYSILDFDNGAVLYNLGYSFNKCESFPLC